jgi:hypothetical protein
MAGTNFRWNALKLAFRLLRIAASTSRESDRQVPRIDGLQPAHPLPLPDWWPFDRPTGLSFDVGQIRLMRRAALEAGGHPSTLPTSVQSEIQESDLPAAE